MAPLHGGSSARKSDLCCGRSLNVVGRPGLHQSGLMSTCFADCPSLGPRKNDLTIYWALGPFVRSFALPVDPGDICPPQVGRRGAVGRLRTSRRRRGAGGVARWAGEASGHAQLVSGGGGGAAGWRGLAALVAAREPASGWAGTGWRRGARGEVVAARWRLCG
jgi:hypothetical protein